MLNVNRWSTVRLDEHVTQAWATWRKRNAVEWTTDAGSFLASYLQAAAEVT